MEFTIKTRTRGDVTFSIPGKSYIFVDLNGKPGTLGRQICHRGKLLGSTMTYSGSDPVEFAKICRRWWRSFLRENSPVFDD